MHAPFNCPPYINVFFVIKTNQLNTLYNKRGLEKDKTIAYFHTHTQLLKKTLGFINFSSSAFSFWTLWSPPSPPCDENNKFVSNGHRGEQHKAIGAQFLAQKLL